LPIPTFYIGALSRFQIIEKSVYKYDYLFLVSGPSPERESFLKNIVQYIQKHDLNASIAIPFVLSTEQRSTGIKYFEQLKTSELETIINKSNTIISKAGYTTIMDFIPFKKKVILLPTKGQFEQLYLYDYHNTRSHELIDKTPNKLELLREN